MAKERLFEHMAGRGFITLDGRTITLIMLSRDQAIRLTEDAMARNQSSRFAFSPKMACLSGCVKQ